MIFIEKGISVLTCSKVCQMYLVFFFTTLQVQKYRVSFKLMMAYTKYTSEHEVFLDILLTLVLTCVTKNL